MATSTAAIVDGFEYQFLYSWYELLSLLDTSSPYEQAWVEHDQAGSADDVVLRARPGAGVVDKFVQVKWHVDQGAPYSFQTFVDVSPKQKRSLLRKLFDSWKRQLGGVDDVEVWLVTNWSFDPVLGGCVRGDRLSSTFFDKGTRTAVGLGRSRWQKEVGQELDRFVRCLRFWPGLSDGLLAQMVAERMARHGLRSDPDAQRRGRDAVRDWIHGRAVTREVLLRTIAEQGLLEERDGEPRVSLWIHGWVKQSHGGAPTRELDWTSTFAGSTRPTLDNAIWWDRLRPELLAAKAELSAMDGGTTIDLRGRLLQTAWLAVGAELPARAGFILRFEQPGNDGKPSLWLSSGPDASGRDFEIDRREVGEGKDILVVFAITWEISGDVRAFISAHPGLFCVRFLAVPDGGPSDRAISSNEDALALVERARALLGKVKGERRPGGRIHLILCGPAAFALFLGQRLNALGDIVTYERTAEEGYQPSVTLRTG